eukprot:4730501-Amphidinium_carterae.1
MQRSRQHLKNRSRAGLTSASGKHPRTMLTVLTVSPTAVSPCTSDTFCVPESSESQKEPNTLVTNPSKE